MAQTKGTSAFDRVLWVVVSIGLLGLTADFIARGLARSFTKPGEEPRGTDFDHFYWAAQAMVQGKPLHSSGMGEYIYPPLVAWLVSPLTHLTLAGAMRVWLVSNLLVTGLALWVLCKEMARRLEIRADPLLFATVSLLTLVANADQIRWEFELAQCDTLVLLGFALGLRWLDRRPWLAGAALGLAFNVKYQSLLALPYLLARRRFVAAGSMVLFSLMFLFLPATTYGLGPTTKSVQVAFSGMLRHVGLGPSPEDDAAAHVYPATYDRSVSITSVAARLTDGVNHPERMEAVTAAAAIVLLGIGAAIYYKRGVPLVWGRSARSDAEPPSMGVVAIEWAGLIVVALAFSPHTLSRHTYLIMPAHVVTFLILCRPKAGVNPWPLIVGVVMFTLGVMLPPGGLMSGKALDGWRNVGGMTWCMLAFYFTLVYTGLGYVQARGNVGARAG